MATTEKRTHEETKAVPVPDPSTGPEELLTEAGLDYELMIASVEGVGIPYDRDRLAADIDEARLHYLEAGELRAIKGLPTLASSPGRSDEEIRAPQVADAPSAEVVREDDPVLGGSARGLLKRLLGRLL